MSDVSNCQLDWRKFSQHLLMENTRQKSITEYHFRNAGYYYGHLVKIGQENLRRHQEFHRKQTNLYDAQKRKRRFKELGKIRDVREIRTLSWKSTLEGIRSFSDIAALENTLKVSKGAPFQILQLQKLIPVSKEFETLVGMKGAKETVFNMVMSQLLTGLWKMKNGHSQTKTTKGLMNVCITGPPGIGKTTISKLIAKALGCTGILSKGHLVVAKRSDLISGYIGQTAPKTEEVLKSAKGGVLLIDEFYSMDDKVSGFAKDSINVLNEFMTLNDDLVVIVAGYEQDINNLFLKNKGLERRFNVNIKLGSFSKDELGEIFHSIVSKAGWVLKQDQVGEIEKFIASKSKEFKNHAGDMESLFTHTRFTASRRIWSNPVSMYSPLSDISSEIVLKDVKEGYKSFSNISKKEDPFWLSSYI
jgi:hypothetical protein